jgi:hypothetical protein
MRMHPKTLFDLPEDENDNDRAVGFASSRRLKHSPGHCGFQSAPRETQDAWTMQKSLCKRLETSLNAF